MPPQSVPAVRFAPPPNHNVRSCHDVLEPDGELKESIRHRVQDVFSSMLKSARQKGIFSDKRAAKFLDWLHVVVEETYRAELAREHQERHEKDDSRPVLLNEKQELINRLQRIENIISGLAAAFPDDVVPSSSNNRPRQSPVTFSAPGPRPNPGPNPTTSHSSSRYNSSQWQENERRIMQESSNFRAIGEAVRQIESDRQRQWSNWAPGRTTPPVPIVKELEEILNRITKAAVPPAGRNNPIPSPSPLGKKVTSSPAPATHYIGSLPPEGCQPHGKVTGRRYLSDSRDPTVWSYATEVGSQLLHTVEKPTEYSTSFKRFKSYFNKTRNGSTTSTGHGQPSGASYTGYNSVEQPPYEFWYPPNMEEEGAVQEVGRGNQYLRPKNAEAKGRGKMSLT